MHCERCIFAMARVRIEGVVPSRCSSSAEAPDWSVVGDLGGSAFTAAAKEVPLRVIAGECWSCGIEAAVEKDLAE